jgi:hypothetical protein
MSSYLPPGCSDREVEYEYSAPYSRDEVAKCDGCGECNMAERMYAVDHYTMCRNCVPICDLCGEFLDNAMFPAKVITIRFARWEMDGQLSAPHCPKCAADWIIGTWLGEAGTWDSDDYTSDQTSERMQITLGLIDAAALPEQWQLQPVKEAHDAA